jgi:hypothetical protein
LKLFFCVVRSEDETSLQSSLNEDSHKSASQLKLSANTPTHSLTPESSLSNVANRSLNPDVSSQAAANPDATFVV